MITSLALVTNTAYILVLQFPFLLMFIKFHWLSGYAFIFLMY